MSEIFPGGRSQKTGIGPLSAQVHSEDLLVLPQGPAGFILKVKTHQPLIYLFMHLVDVCWHQPQMLCVASETLTLSLSFNLFLFGPYVPV